MAIIKPGPMIAEARGKIGGLIFSRNGGGLYVKSWAAPTNPMSTRQTDVRMDFANLVDDWEARLTSGERTDWNDWAEMNPIINRLGEQITISGLNWFIRMNAPRLQAGLVVVDTPPVGTATGLLDTTFAVSDIDPGGANFDIDFDTTLDWVGTVGDAMLVYASAIQSIGVEAFNKPLRFAFAILGDVTSPPTSPATISYPWGGPTGGGKVYAEAVIVESAPVVTRGMRSPYFLS